MMFTSRHSFTPAIVQSVVFGMARCKQKSKSLIRKDIPALVVDFCRAAQVIVNTPNVV